MPLVLTLMIRMDADISRACIIQAVAANISAVQEYKEQFINLAIEEGVLKFGEFELKSGRMSPYFFNAGLFDDGRSLAELGRYYARALTESGLDFDMLFGPAYKGIALATVTAVALADQHGRDVPVAFNRKEVKAYGEGGSLIGATLAGRVIIVDDVISAGTTVRESISLLEHHGAVPAGVLIALDRQERGQGKKSAVQEVEDTLGLAVVSIATLDDLIGHLDTSRRADDLAAVQRYRVEYGV